MTRYIGAIIIGCLLSVTMHAQAVDSYWTGAVDNDFATAGNWTAGVPNGGAGIDGFVTNNPSITLITDLNSPTSSRIRALNIESGTLDIANGGNLQSRNGGSPKTRVGQGSGNIGYINIANGGSMILLGSGADLFIGDAAGGQGFVTVSDGGLIKAKTFEIINGKLTLGSGVTVDGVNDELVVDNNGTLVFITDGPNVATIPGSSLAVELGSTSTLDMQLGGSYSIGDTWTIATDITGFSGVSGGDGSGVFGSVIDSVTPANNFKVHYGTGLAAAGEIVVELVPAPTEFTNVGGDGTWANAANWSAGVPTALTPASVNGDLTANLSGGTGDANTLSVGTISGESGTVQNGSLVVVGTTDIGTATASTGTVSVTSYTAGTAIDNLALATGTDSVGSLTAGSAAISAAIVNVATGSNSVGTVSLTSGTVTAGGEVNIATGQDSSATVAAGTSFVLAATNSLNVGTGSGASHNLTAANFAITSPIGDFAVGAGTGSSIKSLFSANDTIGSITANSPLTLTGGNHEVNGLFIGSGAGAAGSLELSGSATATISGNLDIASGSSSSASLDFGALSSGSHTVAVVNVSRGDLSVGSLTYTNGTLVTTGTMEVGTGGDGADATVLLDSMAGGKDLSIANNVGDAIGITAHMTVLGDSSNGTVRVGRGVDSVSSLTVGGTLTAGRYLNAAGLNSNAVAAITAPTINKVTQNGSIQVAQGALNDGSIIAEDGTLLAQDLVVALGNGSVGVFAITNGTVSMQAGKLLSIAAGNDAADGTVLVGINGDDITVNIGTGTNATGSLTLPNGTLTAKSLSLGGAGTGVGTITLAGGNLTVTNGVINFGASSYIDSADSASAFTWTGKVEADFEALWAVGELRSGGESGLTGATFSNYFTVSGDSISPTGVTPPGVITIAPDPGGVAIGWIGTAGTTYKVWSKDDLVAGSWTLEATEVGVDGSMSVVLPTTDPETFFQVTAE